MKKIIGLVLAGFAIPTASADRCTPFPNLMYRESSFYHEARPSPDWNICPGTGYAWMTSPGSDAVSSETCRTITELLAGEDRRENAEHRKAWKNYWKFLRHVLDDYRADTGRDTVHGRKIRKWYCANLDRYE